MVPDHRLDNELSKVNSDKVKGYLHRSSFSGLGNESLLIFRIFMVVIIQRTLFKNHTKMIKQCPSYCSKK